MNFNILQCGVLSTLCLILCPSTVQSLEPIDRPPFYLNERECMDMFPESFKKDATNAKLRESEEPFDLSLDRKEYNPDASVTVKVFTKESFFPEQSIFGILLQARLAKCEGKDNQKAIGIFQRTEQQTDLETVKCDNSLANGVAFNVFEKGLEEVSISWTPPSASETRTLYFVATVLGVNETFYTNIANGFIVHHSSNHSLEPKMCPLRSFFHESGSICLRGSEHLVSALLSVLLLLFRS